MVDVLTPGHEEHGHGVVVLLLANVAVGGNHAGRGQGVPGHGGAGGADAVGKVRREEAVVAVLGGAPVRHVQVVAEAVDGPVPLNLRRMEVLVLVPVIVIYFTQQSTFPSGQILPPVRHSHNL